MKKKILFLCTGNSCRSQMAEGWSKHFHADWLESYSAGIEPHGMNPDAIRVMLESGVDIRTHTSKYLRELQSLSFDYVITVCGHADEFCPQFPGKTQVFHYGFDDPPKLAKSATNEEERLKHYRRVRDEIKIFIQNLPRYLKPLS